MKKYRSTFLKIVAATWMAFPVSYLLFSTLIFDIPATKIFSLLLSPWFYLLSFFGILTGYGFHSMQRWAWYTFLVTEVMVAYANAVVLLDYSASHHKLLAFLFSLSLLLGLLFAVAREVRVPYFFPKIRWWESNPRYKLSIPVNVELTDDQGILHYSGEILDISVGGCFIKIIDHLPADQLITIHFELFNKKITCQGTVVWLASGAVTHPKGVGVKFAPMVRQQRRMFKAIENRLEKIASLYQSGLHATDQAAFQKKLQELYSRTIETGSYEKKTSPRS